MYPSARHILYQGFPTYFTWKSLGKSWSPRATPGRRNTSSEDDAYNFRSPGVNVVGRIYTVSPRDGERYFLRLLLTQVRGAKFFENLRNIEGGQCNSFRQACLRLGLLADDFEWKNAIRDAFRSSFVPLSHLFAAILAHCEPSDPLSLWNDHLDMFLLYIRHRARGQPIRRKQLREDHLATSYMLREVQDALQTVRADWNLAHFALPLPDDRLSALEQQNEIETPEARAPQWEERVQTSLPFWNTNQRQALEEIFGAMILGVPVSSLLEGSSSTASAPSAPTQSGRLFFVDASGVTGKTLVLSAIQDFLRTRSKQVIPVATSAVAVVLLDEGRTAHSVFKTLIPVSADSTCSFSTNFNTGRTLHQVDLIIWDEIVMCHRHCIETVDRSLSYLMQTDRPFGGRFLVLAGDFRQILPVVRGGSRGQIVSACVKTSLLYRQCRFVRLTENMRLAELRADPDADEEALSFPEFLLSVGEGRIKGQHRPEWIALPPSVAFEHTIRNLCFKAFDGIGDNYADPFWLIKPVILTTKNRPLQQVNEVVGNMISGPYRTYLSADKVEDENTNALRYPTEMLNTLTAGSALPDHKLELKKGFIVMLLRNLDHNNGHVNGARYVIQNMTNNLLFLRITTGSRQGNRLCLPRMPRGPGDENFPILGFVRTQFPIRTCFAHTTNKAQGQSFRGRIGLDLRYHCFSHGQLYVALSRTTHPRNDTALTRESN